MIFAGELGFCHVKFKVLEVRGRVPCYVANSKRICGWSVVHVSYPFKHLDYFNFFMARSRGGSLFPDTAPADAPRWQKADTLSERQPTPPHVGRFCQAARRCGTQARGDGEAIAAATLHYAACGHHPTSPSQRSRRRGWSCLGGDPLSRGTVEIYFCI